MGKGAAGSTLRENSGLAEEMRRIRRDLRR